jgi:peroxiredoxin Q/BCP
MPELHHPAPDITAETDAGDRLTRASRRGRPVVLYFYPRDDTSGCTTEACEFRDLFPRFTTADAVVLGVSPDSAASHVRFKRKYGLPFTLVADTDHRVAEAYGVWKEKRMFGRRYMGVERTTVVIDREGRVARVFERVRPAGHAEAVAAAVGELG